MNIVKTYIDKSSIQGIGLFAAEFIPKGTKIWKLGPLDITYTSEEWNKLILELPIPAVHYLKRYSYQEGDIYILCGDDGKYVNHSYDPNTNGDTAIKDIHPGEEITCNYYDLCGPDWSEEEFKELTPFKPNNDESTT